MGGEAHRTYVETDGEQGHLFQGTLPTLLLTTRGRTTGVLRRTPLIYGRDGDAYVVVASNGGADEHPAWCRNLTADPKVHAARHRRRGRWQDRLAVVGGREVQVLAERFAARARTATGEEKDVLWDRMAGIFPTYRRYQEKTSRDIPVVVLEPTGS